MSHLRILSAGSTLHGLHACVPLAARMLGVEIEISTDHGHNILKSVERGETKADVVLVPADMIDALGARTQGKTPLGTVGVGGVVRAGSGAPDISTMEKLRTALSEADAVLITNAPTGDHLMNVIAQLGLSEAVAPKLLRFDTSTKLNQHLATRSDSALGFGPETEIRAGTGVAWIGDVPDEIQIALPYAAAMLANTRDIESARTFLTFLTSPQAREAFAKTGVRFA